MNEQDLAERGLRYTREHFDELLSETETYVRENPVQSIAYAILAGFILNRLGVGRILNVVVRLVLFALKPAILIYGAAKLYEATQQEER
jgi:DNA phosphorothioation-dependent restriction protein DptG